MPPLAQTFQAVFAKIIARALPTSCIICAAFQDHSLCNACARHIASTGLINYECCSQCGITLEGSEVTNQHCHQCELNPPNYDETYCLDRYDGLLQPALHELKYQKRLAFAHGLANAWNLLFANSLANTNAAYLLPVPLSEQKLCLRGFNQSWELARRIQCGLHIQKPPIRVICPGKVYRNEAISSRSYCVFHQLEGLYIDKNVSFADLKATIYSFARQMFGTDVKLRFRLARILP